MLLPPRPGRCAHRAHPPISQTRTLAAVGHTMPTHRAETIASCASSGLRRRDTDALSTMCPDMTLVSKERAVLTSDGSC